MEFEPMLTPREKSPLPKMSPEEDRTRDAVDSELKHYQLSCSGPPAWLLTPVWCVEEKHYKHLDLFANILLLTRGITTHKRQKKKIEYITCPLTAC